MRKSLSTVAAIAMMAGAVAGSFGGAGSIESVRSLSNGTNSNGPSQKGDALKGAVDRRTTRVRVGSGGVFGGSYFRRAGYGWTNRHQQRVALKARNVKRHRKACR